MLKLKHLDGAMRQERLQAAYPAPADRPAALTLDSAPIGTKAPACIGGYWIKTERGWKWCTGSTFPRPGGDWTGELIPPAPAAAA